MRTGLQVPWLRLNARSIQRLLSQQQLKVNFHIEFRFNSQSIPNQDFYFLIWLTLLLRDIPITAWSSVVHPSLLCFALFPLYLSISFVHVIPPLQEQDERSSEVVSVVCGIFQALWTSEVFTVLKLSSLTPPVCCMDFFSPEVPACVQHDKSDNNSLNLRLIQSCNKNAIPHTDHVQRIASSSLLCDIHILNMMWFHLL